MKTIYTDRFGIYPWALLFVAIMWFWWAYETFEGFRHVPFGLSDSVGGAILILGGCYWTALAAKRFLDVRSAKREGRDPTIIRIKDRGNDTAANVRFPPIADIRLSNRTLVPLVRLERTLP